MSKITHNLLFELCFIGYNKEDYMKSLYDVFGPGTIYEPTIDRPVTRADWPVPWGWRNGSIKTFLKNREEGNEKTGADDANVSEACS